MTIRGIDELEDDEAWSEGTAKFIEDWYNSAPQTGQGVRGAFDVEAELAVTKVTSSSSEASRGRSRERRGRLLRGRAPEDGRALQSGDMKFVQITYNQRSTYRTPDPETYDGVYVATQPFMTRGDQVEYVDYLRGLSPSFEAVASIGSIRLSQAPPPGAVKEPDDGQDEGGSGNNTVPIIVGVVCGVVLLIAIVGLFAYRRRRRKLNEEYTEQVGNGPQSSMRQFGGGNGDLGDSSDSDSDSDSEGSIDPTSMSSPRKNPRGNADNERLNEMALENVSDSSNHSNSVISLYGSERMLQIIAPAGKLGVIVDTPPQGGCAYVCEVKESCPIKDQIQLNDKIIAVDDTDVQKMTAVTVSRLLARRSRQPERKITVLREAGGQAVARADNTLSSMESRPLNTAHRLLGPARSNNSFSNSSRGDVASHELSNEPKPAVEAKKQEELIDVIAPAGKLGVVLVTPEQPEKGPAYVFKIREDSPLVGKVRLGDKVIAIDDEDVQQLSAIDVSKLLGSKSSNEGRKMTMLREVVGSGDGDTKVPLSEETSSGSSSSSSSGSDSGSTSSSSSSDSYRLAAGTSMEEKTEEGSASRIVIIAPAGKLGVVVDSPNEGASAHVSEIKDHCPIKSEIRVGDKIVEVDGEDVSSLSKFHFLDNQAPL